MQTVFCVDYNDETWHGRFTGLSFTLADPANLDWETDGEWIKLPWLGYQTETCQALEVVGPITNIQTYSDNKSMELVSGLMAGILLTISRTVDQEIAIA